MSAKPRSERSDHAPGQGAVDPTKTTSLRRTYAQTLRGQFSALNTEIRAGVRDRDFFGLGSGEQLAPSDPDPLPDYPFPRDDKKIEKFEDWLRTQLDRGVLETVSRNENEYIRSAYNRGVTHADSKLNRTGVTVPEEALEGVFNAGAREETLQRLYTRNYAALRGITDETAKQISEEVSGGFARGINPNEMARNIADRVDSVGKTRATTLARTEVINAHAEGTLDRFGELGIEEVSGEVEWQATGDNRTCERCSSLQSRRFTLKEARGRLPQHPNCRCAWIPVVD